MCYFKSPFDCVYERGDSVALAVISANITFSENTPFNEVRLLNKIESFLFYKIFFFQSSLLTLVILGHAEFNFDDAKSKSYGTSIYI